MDLISSRTIEITKLGMDGLILLNGEEVLGITMGRLVGFVSCCVLFLCHYLPY